MSSTPVPNEKPAMNETKPAVLRILIVEDVRDISSIMARALTNEGYVVDLAEDGEVCLQKANTFCPHLILLDIMLPKIHGIDVLKQLKSNPQTGPIGVIVCTAKNFKSDEEQYRKLGAFDVVFKPFKLVRFLQAIESFFAQLPAPAAAPAAPPIEIQEGRAYFPQVRPGRYCVKLWGTRGSIPVSGSRYVRHGGNTSCLEIATNETHVIIDAGSGIRDLGDQIALGGPRPIHLFITHTHWDHIQGFPFFTPLYLPGFEVQIYGASTFGKDLKSVFRGQLDRDYFPVQFEDMQARVEFHSLPAEPVMIGDLKITWEFTQHPAATVGYKVEVGGKTVALVSDNEFLQGYLGSPNQVALDDPALLSYQKMVAFLSGVDLLIHEAQYTNAEYPRKVGWGHSSLSNACLLACLTKAKRWIVTHHDPLHDDEFLQGKLNLTREIMVSLNCPIEVLHAFDGMIEYF
jgi:CheY-like chemotaxis protein/phosphoribosyl 1,2-cyclic phosphodiesterase